MKRILFFLTLSFLYLALFLPVTAQSSSQSLTWRTHYAGETCFDLAAVFGKAEHASTAAQRQCYRTETEGLLTVHSLRRSGFYLIVAFQFDPDRLKVGDAFVGLSDGLKGKIVYATISPSHQIKRIWFASDFPEQELHRSLARLLIAGLQFTPPPMKSVSTWKAIETDAQGNAAVRYRMKTRRAGLAVFYRTRTDYAQAPSSLTADSQPFIKPGGTSLITYDRNHRRLKSLSAQIADTVFLHGKELGSTKATLEFEFQPNTPSLHSQQMGSLLSEFANVSKSQGYLLTTSLTEAEQIRNAARAALGTETRETLLPGLSEKLNEQNYTTWFPRLHALAVLDLQACAEMGNLVRRGNTTDMVMQVLVAALAQAGTSTAQQELLQSFNAATDPQKRLLLANAIAEIKLPSIELEEALKGAATSGDPLWQPAFRLALGAMIRRLQQSSPMRATALVHWLLAHCDGNSSEELRHLADALGNAGHRAALPMLRRLLRHQDALLRAAAASSLRHIPGSEPNQLLRKALRDKASEVRLEAVYALSWRQPSLVVLNAQIASFQADSALPVRLALLNNLANSRDRNSKINELIKAAAQHDRDQDVQQTARRIIGQPVNQ